MNQHQEERLVHIRAIDIHKSFGSSKNRVQVLEKINLEVKRKEILGIVGASGAGKSTLLHILGVLEQPTQGRILYDELNPYAFNEKRRADFRNRRIGFIFQFHHLLPEFTSLENAMMPALIQGFKRRSAEELAERVLVDLGLKERISHRPGELSGGEAQRVAVARALVLNPAVVLADEPTGNLDSHTGDEVGDLLIDYNRRKGVAMVIVTHNPNLARKVDRIITLVDGKIKEH